MRIHMRPVEWHDRASTEVTQHRTAQRPRRGPGAPSFSYRPTRGTAVSSEVMCGSVRSSLGCVLLLPSYRWRFGWDLVLCVLSFLPSRACPLLLRPPRLSVLTQPHEVYIYYLWPRK